MPRISNPFSCCRPTAQEEKFPTFESALKAGKIDTLRAIIEDKDFNPNVPLKNGAYPLHLAVHKAASDTIIDALLKKGANPFIEDGCGLTATDHALLANNKDKLAQIVRHIVPLDTKGIDDVKKEIPEIGKKVQSASSALQKAISFLEISEERLPAISRDLLKGKWSAESPRENVSEPDCYGMLPLHYAIQLYSVASEENKQLYEEIIKELIDKTKNIRAKTASALSLAHFAVVAKCPEVLTALLNNDSKILKINTLTDLTPLHIAFLQGDFASAKIILDHAPEMLTKPDQNGLTPLQIIVHSILQHGTTAHEKTGPVETKELMLFAMQCLFPLVQAGCDAYCPESIARYVPLVLATSLYAGEYAQAGADAQNAFVQAGVQAYFSPSGPIGFMINARRAGPVVQKSFAAAQMSWNYASYNPDVALKRGIVHLGVGMRSIYSPLVDIARGAAIVGAGAVSIGKDLCDRVYSLFQGAPIQNVIISPHIEGFGKCVAFNRSSQSSAWDQ